MRRARFLASARDDLLMILDYISEASGSSAVAEGFVEKVRRRCRDLASLDTTIGRPRPELRHDVRSVPFGNYVIFFRYRSDDFEVVNIIERHRDIEARFGKSEEE